MSDQEQSLATTNQDTNSQALSAVQNTGGKLASLPDPIVLKERLEKAVLYREMINDHIRSTFKKGIHYYKFHFVKECKIFNCKNESHLSPNWEITSRGAQKLLQDFTFFTDYKTDDDAKRNFPDAQGLVCLICFIYTLEGKFYASGRGNCKTGMYSDENRTVKIAEKRALIDAIKASGLIADFEQVIREIEGELPRPDRVVSQAPIAQPVKETTTNVQASAKWCDSCMSPGPYHSKACPNFKAPQAEPTIRENRTVEEPKQAGEVLEGEVMPEQIKKATNKNYCKGAKHNSGKPEDQAEVAEYGDWCSRECEYSWYGPPKKTVQQRADEWKERTAAMAKKGAAVV